jgi:hypothetical protein
VTTEVTSARWRAGEDRLVLTVSADNAGAVAVRLAQVQVAELVLPGTSLGPAGSSTDPSSAPIAPGARQTITLALPGPVLREHNLLPLSEPQVRITALLFFADAAGNRQLTEIDELTSPVLPR